MIFPSGRTKMKDMKKSKRVKKLSGMKIEIVIKNLGEGTKELEGTKFAEVLTVLIEKEIFQ